MAGEMFRLCHRRHMDLELFLGVVEWASNLQDVNQVLSVLCLCNDFHCLVSCVFYCLQPRPVSQASTQVAMGAGYFSNKCNFPWLKDTIC